MDMEIVFPGGKKVDALYKGFRIKTDQPKFSGGDGSAPAPFDLFLASIGTCAGIYVLAFCRRRNISTEGLKLILRTVRNEETELISRIIMEIQLPSGFPEKYEKAVTKFVELCAVKKHLENPPLFDIYTKKGEK
jgi:ribosomal protein S12 methylthiotransferase accessory factor